MFLVPCVLAFVCLFVCVLAWLGLAICFASDRVRRRGEVGLCGRRDPDALTREDHCGGCVDRMQ